jgi:hypothetical protein
MPVGTFTHTVYSEPLATPKFLKGMNMNQYTQRQVELQHEMATLSGCRAQFRDLWLKNSSADLLAAITSIMARLTTAEQELDAVIAARNLEECLPDKEEVPIVRLRLKI